MEAILVEGVRCFREFQEIPLRKLTLLVGENSTGKSTLLAIARIACNLLGQRRVDFNEEPFLLGTFDQIASWQRSEASKTRSFRIGGKMAEAVEIVATFTKKGTEPHLDRCSLDTGTKHFETEPSDAAQLLPTEANQALASVEKPALHAFSPIRTRPQRTYDPLKETVDPEGTHVPTILSRIAAREPETWESLRQAIQDFGRVSGLFDEVEVRHLGEQDSDPFQLRVKIAGATVNLIDVGYGVSQALPILVDCIRAEPHTTFLLQQPEVHLHPRAQAELGTFLATLSRAQDKQFLVETHSDYLIDRVRMDVRDGKALDAEDVLILYFDRQLNGDVTVHPLEIDEDGNFVDVPPGYRDFFLAEERRFLEGVSG